LPNVLCKSKRRIYISLPREIIPRSRLVSSRFVSLNKIAVRISLCRKRNARPLQLPRSLSPGQSQTLTFRLFREILRESTIISYASARKRFARFTICLLTVSRCRGRYVNKRNIVILGIPLTSNGSDLLSTTRLNEPLCKIAVHVITPFRDFDSRAPLDPFDPVFSLSLSRKRERRRENIGKRYSDVAICGRYIEKRFADLNLALRFPSREIFATNK